MADSITRESQSVARCASWYLLGQHFRCAHLQWRPSLAQLSRGHPSLSALALTSASALSITLSTQSLLEGFHGLRSAQKMVLATCRAATISIAVGTPYAPATAPAPAAPSSAPPSCTI